MKHAMVGIAAEFVDLLRTRLDAGIMTTEDSIRYTFFASLLRQGVRPEQVVLEYPHPAIERAEIDTVVLDNAGEIQTAIEFKYNRAIPSGRNQPMPQQAGKALGDLVRLIRITLDIERYFVYVTDAEMAKYWQNPKNGLREVFELGREDELEITDDYFLNRSRTLRSAMGTWPQPATIACVTRAELPRQHWLRLYSLHTPAS
ncbi:MAG: hypothetical protein O7H41_05900 [Planctomycetota bacterium]|nr:hypothetical protein [Planctomycetota bacterium]